MEPIAELMATDGFDGAVAWAEAHPDVVKDGYGFSKEASTVYAMRRFLETAGLEVRRVEAQAVLLRAVVLQAGASDRVVQMQVSDFEKWLGQQEQIMLSRGEDACDHDFVRMRRDPDFAAMLRDVHDEREMH